jgi:hypothetical protein
VHGIERVVERGDEPAARRLVEVAQHIDVHAGGEGAPRARDHRRPHVGIAGEADEGVGEGGDESGVEQVERRPVQRHPRHAPGALHVDPGVRHQYRGIVGSILRAQ